jgi:hypothetical protein
MKIRMLKAAKGSEEGISTRLYEAGREYDLPDTDRGLDLALVFIHEKWAEEVKNRPVAPENRAIPAAPKNKGR